MLLVVDVGNTRIKWARVVDGRLTDTGGAVHRGSPESGIASLAASLPKRLARAIVANVAGEVVGARIAALLRELAGVAAEFVAVRAEELGVRCAYADPARLGVDRWVAVLAAHRFAPGAACVVDAGTAATFDAVDAHGQHLGGLIMPGPRLLAAALDRNTSDIGATASVEKAPRGLDLLGRTTDSAVGHGACLALAAAVDRAVATVATALGERPTVYLTGGDAPVLHDWLETQVELRADLVLEGLALFSGSAPDSQSSPKGTHA